MEKVADAGEMLAWREAQFAGVVKELASWSSRQLNVNGSSMIRRIMRLVLIFRKEISLEVESIMEARRLLNKVAVFYNPRAYPRLNRDLYSPSIRSGYRECAVMMIISVLPITANYYGTTCLLLWRGTIWYSTKIVRNQSDGTLTEIFRHTSNRRTLPAVTR